MKIVAEITKKGYTITVKEDEQVVFEVKMLKIKGGARGTIPAAYEKMIDELGFRDAFEKIDSACFDELLRLNRRRA